MLTRLRKAACLLFLTLAAEVTHDFLRRVSSARLSNRSHVWAVVICCGTSAGFPHVHSARILL